ncbi:hypothetical protein LMG24076_04239 [Trinickia soli]|nr:hypothetical protein LMG24076_04239 [Trinickia soli]
MVKRLFRSNLLLGQTRQPLLRTGKAIMQSDHTEVPHYLVLREGCEPYVLNADRRVVRREASRLLRAFARSCGRPTSIADDTWNAFSSSESILLIERAQMQAYALVSGIESEHQLRLLAGL